MKKIFMLLFSLAIVTGVAAFTGGYEKSPPIVPTVVVFADQVFEQVTPAVAEISNDITTEAGSYLIFEAVIPYQEFNLFAPENERARWQHPSLYLTSIKKEQSTKVKPTLNIRSCLELNC